MLQGDHSPRPGWRWQHGTRLLAPLLILAACASLRTAEAADPVIKNGGTMVAAITDNPPDLMPGISTDLMTAAIGGQIFDSLVKLDPKLSVVPDLAKSWEMSPDGLTYTFHLREGVKWQDGQPFTSDDVKFSLLEIDGKYNSIAIAGLKSIASIDTPDPLTVVIHMSSPDPAFFPWAIGEGSTEIFPKHIYAGSDPRTNPANFTPVGTGPFKFKEWVRGSYIMLERNPDYFDASHVDLDRVVFQVMPDATARQVALEHGDVDYLPYFSLAPQAIDPLSKDPSTQVIDSVRPALGEIVMFFNLRNAPLNNKDVRHAIAFAIDRAKVIDLALDGRGKVPTGPLRTDNPPFYTSDVPIYAPDPAKANALLDQAGFPRKAGGTRFSIRLSYQGTGEGGALQAAGEVMREELRDVGIDLQLMPMDPAAWQQTAFIQWDFDMTMGSFLTGPDPKIGIARNYLTEYIVKQNATNLMGYSNPQVDTLFHTADKETNPTTRAGLYQQAQKLIVEDLPALWLWEKSYPIAVRKGLVGLPSGAMHYEGFVNVGWTK